MNLKFPWLWVGVAVCSFELANLKAEMFGTGEIDWAHYRFMWTMNAVGALGVLFSTVKAYRDQGGTKTPVDTIPKVEIKQPEGQPVPVHQEGEKP